MRRRDTPEVFPFDDLPRKQAEGRLGPSDDDGDDNDENGDDDIHRSWQ